MVGTWKGRGGGCRAGGTAIFLALALGACASMEIGRYKSDCIEVTAGQIEIDCDNETWSFSGLCARKRHSACPDLTRFVFEAGVDSNDNGQLDAGEATISVDHMGPGDEICTGAASGSTDGEKHEVLYHYEVYVEGQDKPVVSKTEKGEPE
jgi:hypothetical protein